MRYASPTALSMPALARCIVSSTLSALAVAQLCASLLKTAGLGTASLAAIGLPSVAAATDMGLSAALPAPKKP